MPYTFAIWIRNYEKCRALTKYRVVTADSLYEAYQKIIEDTFEYYMEDGDILDKVEIIATGEDSLPEEADVIAINKGEYDDTDRVKGE